MQDNILTLTFVKDKSGHVTHANPGFRALFLEFEKSLEIGQQVEVFFEADKDNGTHDQLGLVHVTIRKLAVEIGTTFEEMKLAIKKKSGFAWESQGELVEKSFGRASREELGLVIEAIKEVASLSNISV